jgi:hypothetical protein
MAISFKARSMAERWKEQLAGLVIVILGLVVTYGVWDLASRGESYFVISLAAPAFVVLGLGLVLFPSYRLERIAKGEEVDDSYNFKMITPRWRVILGVMIVVELLFYLYITYGL